MIDAKKARRVANLLRAAADEIAGTKVTAWGPDWGPNIDKVEEAQYKLEELAEKVDALFKKKKIRSKNPVRSVYHAVKDFVEVFKEYDEDDSSVRPEVAEKLLKRVEDLSEDFFNEEVNSPVELRKRCDELYKLVLKLSR